MKKILIVAHLQSHIMNFHIPMIKKLQTKGYTIYVATKLDKDRYNSLDEDLQKVVWKDIEFNRNPFSKNSIISVKQLIEIMKEDKFDLIHVNTPIAAFLARLAAKITDSKNIIYTAHGFHFYKGAPVKNWIIYYTAEKIAAKWTDCIITMNEEDYKIAKKRLNIRRKENIFKINGVGVDLDKYYMSENMNIGFKESIGLKSNDFVITMIGEINTNKNQIQLIKALNELKNKYEHLKVLVVGEGDEIVKLKEYIFNNKLEDRVIFLGFRNDIPNILNITDVLASMSAREGLPKNVLEAMAAKIAIIATDIRGNCDLVENLENGILVNYGDYKAVADAIEKLFEDRNILEKLASNSQEKSKLYSLDVVLNQIEEIYSRFI